MNYYPAYVCENGHTVEAASYDCTDKYCTLCGAPVIAKCPACNAELHGHPTGCSGYYEPPAYCRACGKPLPWTDKAIQSAILLLAEDENISADECNRIAEILPDAITETPKTQLAAVRIKKALKMVGEITAEGIKKFIIDFGCELIKNQLDL